MFQKITIPFITILAFQCSIAQSFEETSFPDLTTTPSASRSANFIDVNGDGWDDLFITNGPFEGANNALYINNQDGSFTTVTMDDIVSDGDRSDGASFADADNDGDLDAMVVTFGANGVGKKNYFYRNNGDNSFTYEPDIAMGTPLTYSEMCTWIDINNDQYLDVYITNSVGDLTNQYFENQTDGTFTQVTNLPVTNETKPSRSVDWIDYDGDGDCDIYVTNEGNQKNTLYRNDGVNNYTQVTDSSITSNNNNSAGSSWGDIDNDGDFDLFVANYANNGRANQLFINEGGTFTENTSSIIATTVTNSFGSSFGDVDNDGDLDLLVCNAYLDSQNTNFLYLNDGTGNFSLDTNSALATHEGWTFGCAFGDYDNDGWLDALLANNLEDNQVNSVYHNTGTGNNWVKLNCIGTASNTSAVGATVRLKAIINGNEIWQTRKIAASSGYCSQNSYTVHFGLGNANSIEELIVQWPAGTTELFEDIAINEIHAIEEGTGTLGNNNFSDANNTLYPNPVKDILTIEINEAIASGSLIFQLFNTQGQLVEEKKVTPEASDNLSINLSHIQTGVYHYVVSQKGLKWSGKIIKK